MAVHPNAVLPTHCPCGIEHSFVINVDFLSFFSLSTTMEPNNQTSKCLFGDGIVHVDDNVGNSELLPITPCLPPANHGTTSSPLLTSPSEGKPVRFRCIGRWFIAKATKFLFNGLHVFGFNVAPLLPFLECHLPCVPLPAHRSLAAKDALARLPSGSPLHFRHTNSKAIALASPKFPLPAESHVQSGL